MRIPGFVAIAVPLLAVSLATGWLGFYAPESAEQVCRAVSLVSGLFAVGIGVMVPFAALVSRAPIYATCDGCGEPFQADPMHRQCPDCADAILEMQLREEAERSLGADAYAVPDALPDSTDYARTTGLVAFPKDAA